MAASIKAKLQVALLAMAMSAEALVSPDGTGRVPAMGWNSWNEYACDINETVFLEVSDLLVELGLKDLGYTYVNIDDCWSNKELRRDNTTQRIIPDYVKFPNGIDGLAKEMHAKGLKLGIYSDAGTSTCGGYAGSLGYEDIDAAAWSEWGIDYLKYDNCNVPEEWVDEYPYYPEGGYPTPPLGYDYGASKTAQRYGAMRDALLAQNRTIQYSLCAWGHAHVEQWGNGTGHSWRMWGDIYPSWAGQDGYSWGLMPIVNQAARHWNDTGFWGRNDWDMLEVGNGNLTLEESRSHFALWAAFKSPLIVGTRLAGISEEVLSILRARELIDFNQDARHGEGVMPFAYEGEVPPSTNQTAHPPSHYVGTSAKGMHVFLLNSHDEDRDVEVRFGDVPGLLRGRAYLVHDMWTGEDVGVFSGGVTVRVKRHDTAALRINLAKGCAGTQTHPNPQWTPSTSHLF
ncbi:glycoside hydrolase superfamily [Stachybotrys elegans]|uniref:Alpha-galactosidase n=1 Tax=Stachybotrys elegans TaxID=80388 RepID=A0A8K0WPC4_9HYPO|nr:glycoside hydrolase superfamily [Stachybotrys elegans]